VADLHHLTELFEGFTAKPDIVVDDMPSTCLTPFVYNVGQEASWPGASSRSTSIEREFIAHFVQHG